MLGLPILARWHIYIESGSWCLCHNMSNLLRKRVVFPLVLNASVDAMSLRCMRQTFRCWSTIHKARKLAVLLAKLVPKEPKCSRSVKMSVSAEKNESDCTWDRVIPFFTSVAFFGIVNKFNWYLRNLCPLLLIIGLCKTNTAKFIISDTHQTPKRKWFSSRLAVAFAQTTEARS